VGTGLKPDKRIKAVLFDFGQTLADSASGFRSAEKDAQKKIFKNLALTEWNQFLQNYRRIRNDLHAKSKLSRFEIWQEVYWYYCRDCEKELLEKWEHEYWCKVKENTTLFPETRDALKELSKKYKLGLITNTEKQKIETAHRISLFTDIEKFFSEIIIAGQDNIPPKPDPTPFKLCLQNLDIKPTEAVYVGDDWDKDICGSQNAGLKPVWIKHRSVQRNFPDIKTDVPVINNLEDIFGLDYLKL
jgi:HAD superfamily hydrolase (TIGR01549 family)